MVSPRANFRTMLPAIAPPWLQDVVGQKVLYTMGAGADAVINKLVEGVRMRMPGYGDSSALPHIGNDRVLPRGPSETDAEYILRLKQALDSWRIAGNARSVAQAVRAYLSPFSPTMRFFDRTGNWYTWTSDMNPQTAPPSVTHGVPPNIDSAGGPYAPFSSDVTGFQRWNYWLVIYSSGSQQWCTRSPALDSGDTWDSGHAWDFSQPQSLFDGLRAAVQSRQSQNAWCRNIIVVFGAENTLLDPTGTLGTDGKWGFPAKISSGVVVPSRPASTSWIDGSNTINVSSAFNTTPTIAAPTDPLLPR